jgi:hypothetical protein
MRELEARAAIADFSIEAFRQAFPSRVHFAAAKIAALVHEQEEFRKQEMEPWLFFLAGKTFYDRLQKMTYEAVLDDIAMAWISNVSDTVSLMSYISGPFGVLDMKNENSIYYATARAISGALDLTAIEKAIEYGAVQMERKDRIAKMVAGSDFISREGICRAIKREYGSAQQYVDFSDQLNAKFEQALNPAEMDGSTNGASFSTLIKIMNKAEYKHIKKPHILAVAEAVWSTERYP